MLVALTFEIPLLSALPMSIFCEFSRPDWLWLIFDAVTFDLPPPDALPRFICWLFSRPDWLWLTPVTLTFDSLPLPSALPTAIFCEFSRPDWLWLIFEAVTFDLPPAVALPRSICWLFSRPDWLWLMASTVTFDCEPLCAKATPANRVAIATATTLCFTFMASPYSEVEQQNPSTPGVTRKRVCILSCSHLTIRSLFCLGSWRPAGGKPVMSLSLEYKCRK